MILTAFHLGIEIFTHQLSRLASFKTQRKKGNSLKTKLSLCLTGTTS